MRKAQPVPGATVIAVHAPSGTTYEAVTQGDGRFLIPGMRVGGPYKVTADTRPASLTETQDKITLTLGVAQDVNFTLQARGGAGNRTVTATVDPVFSSSRTGAATAVTREDIAALPTVTGRISDVTRLTPQASGNSSFAGQDNRMNNMTVDGSSSTTRSASASGQPGDRTDVAPISLESIEQVQVSVAPYDVRQGNFIGAARQHRHPQRDQPAHRVRLSPDAQRRLRRHRSGRPDGEPRHVHVPQHRRLGRRPDRQEQAVRVRQLRERERQARRSTPSRANHGRSSRSAGSVTRVLASDLDSAQRLPEEELQLRHRPATRTCPRETPAKRYLIRSDYNLNNSNKVSFRYNQLDSSSGKNALGLDVGRARPRTVQHRLPDVRELELRAAREHQVGHRRVERGHRQQHVATAASPATPRNDESRGDPASCSRSSTSSRRTARPTPRSAPSRSRRTTSCATTRTSCRTTSRSSAARHSLTFGGTRQKYRVGQLFFNCCKQSAYVYNSLHDFYTDANGFLANPNRTVSPVTLRAFQVRYSNIPGVDKPIQPLKVWYGGGYVQDEWRRADEPDGHRRRALRHVVVRQHGVSQSERRRADVPR